MNYTSNFNLYKWNYSDQKQDTITEMSNNMDKIDASLADIVTNIKYPPAPQVGCKMDGVTDDTMAFQNILNSNPNRKIKIPHDGVLLITSPIVVTQQIILEGEGGTIHDIYAGSQAISRIKYTGTGTFLKIDGTTSPTTGSIYPSGSRITNLSIEGTSSASSAIKVNERGCASTSMRNITLENVFVFNFTSGWGFELHEVYTSTLINCNVENCGGLGLLVNAHATSLIGGSYEQSCFGFYINGARPVSFTGTTIEGVQASRAGCNIPSGFTVWSQWASSSNPRPTVNDYKGSGLVSYGALVILDKCYFEGNDWTVVGELSSHVILKDSYVEVNSAGTTTNIGAIDFGGLYLQVEGNKFIGNPTKNHIFFESSIATNYAYVKNNERDSGVNAGKLMNTPSNVCGIVESEELWGRKITHYNTRIGSDSLLLNPIAAPSEWNQLYVDSADGKLKFKDNTGVVRIVNVT